MPDEILQMKYTCILMQAALLFSMLYTIFLFQSVIIGTHCPPIAGVSLLINKH